MVHLYLRRSNIVFTDKKRRQIFFSAVYSLGIAFLLLLGVNGCSKMGNSYLGPMQTSSGGDSEETIDLDTPIQIHYFFDRTESMKGFTQKEDSAYRRTIPLVWEAGERLNLTPPPKDFYYVYGDTQIGSLQRQIIQNRGTGLHAESFYGIVSENDPRLGQRVYYNQGKPFNSVYEFIHSSIDPDSRSLYVVVSDFYETDNPNIFARFFGEAFRKNLSGAIFAIESDFNGVLYDVYGYETNRFGDIQKRGFPSNGSVTSTFFVLLIGSQSEVFRYSERLFYDLQGRNINFFNTIFLIGPSERVSPIPSRIIRATNRREFNKEENLFSMVNLRRDNTSLGLYQWDGTNRVPANVEAYQIVTRVGSRYATQLTDRAFLDSNNFEYPVIANIEYHTGEKTSKVDPGFVSQFRDYPNSREHFELRTFIKSVETENKALTHPLYLVAETNNNNIIASGYYRITYNIQAKALTPEWVKTKNAEEIADVELSRDQDRKLKIYRLKNLYEQISEAYNNTKSRAGWSGEFYLVRRR